MPRILLVDDEPVILSVLQSTLSAPDREFLVAGTAAEGLELALKASSVEVAIVDKNLPDRTGLEVARELKHLHPDIEVILLTGYASLDSAIEAVKVGAFDYISKPIEDFDDLNLKVQNAAEKVRLKREQRRLMDRFAESEERYRGVFQSSSDAILVADAETGAIQDVNLAAERLYGFSKAELTRLKLADLRVNRAEPPAPAGPHPERHLKKDGSPFPAEVTEGEFLLQRRGTRIVAVRDVSEREQAEAERQRLQEHLRQVQKMDAVGRLAGGVSHDFNNLLTVIIGNSELMLEKLEAGDKRGDYAREILDAANRASALTRQLLLLSRKKTTRLEVLDLNAVVRDLQKILRRTIGEHIELVVSLEPEPWRTRADADQIGQVLLNLALNARDAMPTGGKLVIETSNAVLDSAAVRQQPGLQPGEYVSLAVTDNGVGMTRDIQERIFEPFFTTKPLGLGTGLGLATVYGIAQQAGGTVRVYSEPGAGTTFQVYLPRTSQPAQEKPAAPAAEPKRFRASGETVLVAEDEPAVRNLMRQLLGAAGCVVLEGGDGEEAWNEALRHRGRIDLLITDLVMPKCSGRDLAKRLHEARPEMKVLYMSAHSAHAVAENGQLEPSARFLQKPFTEQALLAQVEALLKMR